MRSWQPQSKDLELTRTSKIVVDSHDYADLSAEAKTLALSLAPLTHRQWRITKGNPANGDIFLTHSGSRTLPAEGYELSIGAHVEIRGSSAGVFYGGQTLLQLVAQSGSRILLPRGEGQDYPEYQVRSVMIDLGRHYYEVPQIEALMRDMAWKKLNTLHLHFTDWLAFRLRSDKFPGLASEQSYDRADIQRLETVAAHYHITIIPEIDLPAHAIAMTRYKPSLGFSCPTMRNPPWDEMLTKYPAMVGQAWTIDITKSENRAWVRDVLNEFIPWFHGPYFHIGGDEYQYDDAKMKCPELMAATKAKGYPYPGDVIIDWINQANQIVKAHGKKAVVWTWWGDKDNKTSIKPDRDIIVDAWNEPLQQQMIDDGYETILTPGDHLYVTPGKEGNHEDSYGMVDTQKIYETYPFSGGHGVLGYQLSVWSDDAEKRTDRYFLGKAYEPMTVVAERLWSGKTTLPVWDLFRRANAVSLPPLSRPYDLNY